jgi:hypothetical protein
MKYNKGRHRQKKNNEQNDIHHYIAFLKDFEKCRNLDRNRFIADES